MLYSDLDDIYDEFLKFQKAKKDSSGSHLNGQIQALVDMLVAEEGISLGSVL